MLGAFIHDPDYVESDRDTAAGLDLLPIETTFAFVKSTFQVNAVIERGLPWLEALAETPITGYEIHSGHTSGATGWLTIRQRGEAVVEVADGAGSADGRIWGCYLHGLFANEAFRRAWLSSLGWRGAAAAASLSLSARFDALADHIESALDIDRLLEIVDL
jgi:adenosylcobyric acid synthase